MNIQKWHQRQILIHVQIVKSVYVQNRVQLRFIILHMINQIIHVHITIILENLKFIEMQN